MANSAGLWIDHRKAVVVLVSGEAEQLEQIESGMDGHVRYSGGPEAGGEYKRERRFENELDAYYDRVIERIKGADSILIFGPGEAKGELKARLDHAKLGRRVLPVETVDKMTDSQVAAKVRQSFHDDAAFARGKTASKDS